MPRGLPRASLRARGSTSSVYIRTVTAVTNGEKRNVTEKGLFNAGGVLSAVRKLQMSALLYCRKSPHHSQTIIKPTVYSNSL